MVDHVCLSCTAIFREELDFDRPSSAGCLGYTLIYYLPGWLGALFVSIVLTRYVFVTFNVRWGNLDERDNNYCVGAGLRLLPQIVSVTNAACTTRSCSNVTHLTPY